MKILLNTRTISGIYEIRNIKNNKFYIGSSKNIYYRLHRHKSDLLKNKHHNPYMQNAYNNDKEFFIGRVLEKCNISELRILEQNYINKLNPHYNIIRDVELNSSMDNLECRLKVSNTLKKGYLEGRLKPTRITPIDIYNLNSEKIHSFSSIKEAADTLKLKYHKIQTILNKTYYKHKNLVFVYKDEVPNFNFMKKGYSCTITDIQTGQITSCKSLQEAAVLLKSSKHMMCWCVKRPGHLFRNQYLIKYATKNSVNCLETPEEDNQQPSSCSDTEKGSTTSSESHRDNNSTTKAGHSTKNEDIV